MENFLGKLTMLIASFFTAILSLFYSNTATSTPPVTTINPINIASTTRIQIEENNDALEEEKGAKNILKENGVVENHLVPEDLQGGTNSTDVVILPQSPTNQTIDKNVSKLPTLSWDEINEKARAATVNILCTSAAGGLFSPISGSGVIVDSKGIILVNAHLAQYLLLKDYPSRNFIDCVVRQGNPASPRYHAELLYISPSWVRKNYKDILIQEPLGTGENDYAFLRIGEPTGPSIEREKFPFLEVGFVETKEIIGHPILVTAYPAGFLGGISIQKNLFLSSATANIQDVYTYEAQTIDLISLGGSIVSQQGSSGGAVVNSEGKLIGIVATSSDAPTTEGRDLRAITLSYINQALQKETGITLQDFLENKSLEIMETFRNEVAQELITLYINMFSSQQ